MIKAENEESEYHKGVVVDLDNDFVIINIKEKYDQCVKCKLKNFCLKKNDQNNSYKVRNTLNAKVGDVVIFNYEPIKRIYSSFLIFILPVVILIFSYMVCKKLFFLADNSSILISMISLPFSFFILKLLNNYYKRKNYFKPYLIKIKNYNQS